MESPGLLSCKLRGLTLEEWNTLQKALADLQISSSRQEEEDFYEIETHGVRLLNMLNNYHSYILISQSMVIEKSYIGGRNVQIQKIAWTLNKSID